MKCLKKTSHKPSAAAQNNTCQEGEAGFSPMWSSLFFNMYYSDTSVSFQRVQFVLNMYYSDTSVSFRRASGQGFKVESKERCEWGVT